MKTGAQDSAVPDESRAIARRKTRSGNDVDLKTGDIVQNSMVVPGRWWRVTQTLDTITPGSSRLQREVALRENDSQRQRDLGRRAGRRSTSWRIATQT